MFENPILREASKQEILQQMFRKFQISNRLPNRYFPKINDGCPYSSWSRQVLPLLLLLIELFLINVNNIVALCYSVLISRCNARTTGNVFQNVLSVLCSLGPGTSIHSRVKFLLQLPSCFESYYRMGKLCSEETDRSRLRTLCLCSTD